jgi:hypothetical protein
MAKAAAAEMAGKTSGHCYFSQQGVELPAAAFSQKRH